MNSHREESKAQPEAEEVKEYSLDEVREMITEIKNGNESYSVIEEGEYYGVQWKVTEQGLLLLSGTDDLGEENYRNASWGKYKY